MKIPNEISTITELAEWVERKKPKVIEIGEKSNLQEIVELTLSLKGKGRWKRFRSIPIRYLK